MKYHLYLMESIRAALCKHMETIRAFVIQGVQVDSGVYDTEHFEEIFRYPGRIVEWETEWISSLLNALQSIQRYIQLVGRWADHFYGLAQNLGISREQFAKVWASQGGILQKLQEQSFEEQYLRWVVADVSEEIDRLAAASKELETEAPLLVELATKYGGPFLEQNKEIALNWMASEHLSFYTNLIAILQAAHATKGPEEMIRKLALYLDIIAGIVAATPMFVIASTLTTFSLEHLEASQKLMNQIITGTEDLRTFMGIRTQAYLQILRHEEALMRAVLPPKTLVSEWLSKHAIQHSTPTDQLLPDSFVTENLPLALQLAEDALTKWDNSIEATQPYLAKAVNMNKLLKSPAVTKFLAADQRRLELFYEWRPRIAQTFAALRTTIKDSA